jgi:SAM-dependent methyltransferase
MNASRLLGSREMSVESVNAAYWPTTRSVRRRARRSLRPVEAALLARYRPQLSGNVLEVGSRGDGLTAALYHHARCLTGVAFSTPEVEWCRSRYGRGFFQRRNLVDLDEFEDGRFDAVVAGCYALDCLGHDQRDEALGRLSRIIASGGVLIISTHNLASESLVRTPVRYFMAHPWTIWKLPRALRNRALLGRLQQRSHGYAILNDPSAAHGRLSHYVCRDQQERELLRHGLQILECVDRSDRSVTTRGQAQRERELHFVARPALGG